MTSLGTEASWLTLPGTTMSRTRSRAGTLSLHGTERRSSTSVWVRTTTGTKTTGSSTTACRTKLGQVCARARARVYVCVSVRTAHSCTPLFLAHHTTLFPSSIVQPFAGALVGFAAVVGGTAVPAQAAKLDLYINDTLYGVKPGTLYINCTTRPNCTTI